MNRNIEPAIQQSDDGVHRDNGQTAAAGDTRLPPLRHFHDAAAHYHIKCPDCGNILVYQEFEAELGVGLRFFGFQPAVGIYVSAVPFGIMEIESSTMDSSVDVTGMNSGTFVELVFQTDRFPLFASARVQNGDVEGSAFTFGAAF